MKIKKIITFIFCILLLFLLFFFIFNFFKKDKKKLEPLISNFKANAIVITNEKEIQFELVHSKKETSMTMYKPKNLEGFTFFWDENQKQKILFNDISHEFDKNIASKNSYLNLIVKIINCIHEESKLNLSEENINDSVKFQGEIDNINFDIISDKNGLIKEINIPQKNVKVMLESVPIEQEQ